MRATHLKAIYRASINGGNILLNSRPGETIVARDYEQRRTPRMRRPALSVKSGRNEGADTAPRACRRNAAHVNDIAHYDRVW